MKILIYSPVFHPMIGGLENVTALLAQGLHNLGHEVCVVCNVEHSQAEPFLFTVLRKPSWKQFLHRVRWAEVVLQMQVSLRGLWPLIFSPRRLVISHQTWLSEWNRPLTWQHYLKHIICRFATNVACSTAVAEALELKCQIVPNPYDEAVFRHMPAISRERDILFVGRLVSDKGCSTLIEAVKLLSDSDCFPTVTIIGGGPEQDPLLAQVKGAEMEKQFIFTGPLRGEELAREMNRHHLLVVPSLWPEPFGIVALEGMACGCAVIGSRLGGLAEAMGPSGKTFENGNPKQLAALLLEYLVSGKLKQLQNLTDKHLKMHTKSKVSQVYAKILAIDDRNKADNED